MTTNPNFIFWAVFLLITILVVFFDRKYAMLRDNSTAICKSYSFSRVQLIWWTMIVFAAFISIILLNPDHDIPTLWDSTLYLLGISSGTAAAAKLIDISDSSNQKIQQSLLNQNQEGQNFFMDILSDNSGISVHRFQTVVLNVVFGCWFISKVLTNLNHHTGNFNAVIPDIKSNDLVLLGLSSGIYAGLKATENKQAAAPATAVQHSTIQNSDEQPVA